MKVIGIAMSLFVLLLSLPALGDHYTSTGHRICVCKKYGTRGGCAQWSCRRAYHRHPAPLESRE